MSAFISKHAVMSIEQFLLVRILTLDHFQMKYAEGLHVQCDHLQLQLVVDSVSSLAELWG